MSIAVSPVGGRLERGALLFSGLMLACAPYALAQDAQDQSSSAAPRMDVIVITAERREAAILDTPVAVTALSGEMRD